MAKWEYCAVVGLRRSGNNTVTSYYPSVEYFTAKGVQTVPIRGDTREDEIASLARTIAQLGEEGWEMVGCGNNSEVTHSIYFKRLKP